MVLPVVSLRDNQLHQQSDNERTNRASTVNTTTSSSSTSSSSRNIKMKRTGTISTTKPMPNTVSTTTGIKHARIKKISSLHVFQVVTLFSILFYLFFNRISSERNFSFNNNPYTNITAKQDGDNNYVTIDQNNSNSGDLEGETASHDRSDGEKETVDDKRCAILFWGLPRAFESLVLPSVEENIIRPNQQYNCDYFVHYYHQTTENSGRSGSGGIINPEAIYSLKTVIEKHTNAMKQTHKQSRIEFTYDTEADFWTKYTPLIEKIRTSKDDNGKYLYFPWKAVTYVFPTTTDNIIKMWHSIESSWNLMESTSSSKSISYDQVAMVRSDVFYVNPIDIFYNPITNQSITENTTDPKFVVIPNFGNYPISDRFVYGSYDAVKIWASERFSRLEGHVKSIYENNKGWGLHSERFMNYTIFPAIRQLGYKVLQHPTMCFFRARADESLWISDCSGKRHIADPRIMKSLGGSLSSIQTIVERIIQRNCLNITKAKRNVKVLPCPKQ
jgi:hypothetical protein